MRFHPLTVTDLRLETHDTVSVSFDVPDDLTEEFDFTQGQHLTLRREFDGEEVRRSYSLCSSVFDDDLRIAVKSIADGRFSRFIHQTLTVGDVIDVGSPIGHFNVPLSRDSRKRYVAFAAGSGITPVISIIKTTLAVEPQSTFTLVYGNRETRSIIFREELEALKNRYLNRLSIIHVLSRESRNIPLLDGRIDRSKVDLLLASILIPQHYDEFFVCGPKDMIDNVQDALLAKKVDKFKIHFELFTAPGQAFARNSRRTGTGTSQKRFSTVTVLLEGKSTELTIGSNDDTVLEAVRRVRPEVPYACESGVCATCRAKLLKGQVDTYLDLALEDHDRDAGYILTCQSRPVSEQVVLDFDAL